LPIRTPLQPVILPSRRRVAGAEFQKAEIISLAFRILDTPSVRRSVTHPVLPGLESNSPSFSIVIAQGSPTMTAKIEPKGIRRVEEKANIYLE
jgi:hypothetical protein